MSRSRDSGCIGLAAALLSVLGLPAAAQEARLSRADAPPESVSAFSLPPLTIEKAAMALCEQAGWQLVMDGAIAHDLEANPLKVRGTVAQAFDTLLAPTNLRWRIVGPRTIAIEARDVTPETDASVLLKPLRIEGTREGRTSEEEANRWDKEVRARLERHKRYPNAAQQQGLQDIVYLRILSDRKGNVLGTDIVRSRGIYLLDEAAKEVVRRTGRLPALPQAFQGSPFSFVIPLVFYLR